MKGNKYDNLFGEDRDWIEDALRDYDVPDGVINEIGAHFFVLQTKVDKLVAEKENKRDIFAEIGREAMQDDELKSFFGKIAADKPKNVTPTVDELMAIWPVFSEAKYNTYIEAHKLRVSATVTHDGYTAFFTYASKHPQFKHTTDGQAPVREWLGKLRHDQRVSLLKKLKKNIQRTADKAKQRKKTVREEPELHYLKQRFHPITVQSIADLWPIGMVVSYYTRDRIVETSFQRTSSDTLLVTQHNHRTHRTTPSGTTNLHKFIRDQHYYDRRKLVKRILKNKQRRRDSIV
jgi:hypothetical protein